MKKQFSTCLLIQEGSLAPELLSTEVNLHPGCGFSSDQGKAILVAGGFSSVFPESGFPLSPTLQLNHDLAMFDNQQLAAIARAERQRFSAVNYRSYTVAADNRVAVIGDSAEQLLKFVDTYGGVLAIEPLLVDTYHSEFPTLFALQVDSVGHGCRLEFQLRSPLCREKCTYCGRCAATCPRQCISETLFFDYSRCDFCAECEVACPSQAITLHDVTHHVLEVPAIVLLNGVSIDLVAVHAAVFTEERLPDYFATVFPSRIEEIISYDHSLCQFSGRFGYGCDLCLKSCRHGAIAQDHRGVTVDSGKCLECGACIAVCPTGALQNERFTDRMFVDYFSGKCIPEDGTVVIGGEKALHRLWWRQQGTRREKIFFLQYETAHGLNLFHYLHLYKRGARRIVVLFAEEDELGAPMAQHQVDQANWLIHHFAAENPVIIATPRDFDTHFDDTFRAGPRAFRLGQFDNDNIPFAHRRQAVAQALEALVRKSGEEIVLQPEVSAPFATITCDREKCSQCLACLNECRLAALHADQQLWTLNSLAALCVGCSLCVRVCPEGALTMSPSITLDHRFFLPVELARAEPMACRSCGKIFGSKKSLQRVMAILAAKEAVDSSHFELCAMCRVVELFQVQQ